MKAFYFPLCCVILASSSLAYGDTLLTGSVTANNFAGTLCSASTGPTSSASLNCATGNGDSAFLGASLGLTTGNVNVGLQSVHHVNGNFAFTTDDQASFDVAVDGTYILPGGTGDGLVGLDLTASGSESFFSLFGSCSISLDGVTQNCNPPVDGSYYFLVPYNTPVQLDFTASWSDGVIDGDAEDGTLSYNFGALQPTPEPANLWLLGLAAGIPAALLSRRRFADL